MHLQVNWIPWCFRENRGGERQRKGWSAPVWARIMSYYSKELREVESCCVLFWCLRSFWVFNCHQPNPQRPSYNLLNIANYKNYMQCSDSHAHDCRQYWKRPVHDYGQYSGRTGHTYMQYSGRPAYTISRSFHTRVVKAMRVAWIILFSLSSFLVLLCASRVFQ